MTIQEIFNAVLAFDEETVKAKTQAELDGGTDISAILNDGLISAMDEVGERFSAGELFVPEMLMAWWSSARSRAIFTTSARTWFR